MSVHWECVIYCARRLSLRVVPEQNHCSQFTCDDVLAALKVVTLGTVKCTFMKKHVVVTELLGMCRDPSASLLAWILHPGFCLAF